MATYAGAAPPPQTSDPRYTTGIIVCILYAYCYLHVYNNIRFINEQLDTI